MPKNTYINIFLKISLILDDVKNNLNEQRSIINSQWCYHLMKAHRTKLGVEVNNKNSLIMH